MNKLSYLQGYMEKRSGFLNKAFGGAESVSAPVLGRALRQHLPMYAAVAHTPAQLTAKKSAYKLADYARGLSPEMLEAATTKGVGANKSFINKVRGYFAGRGLNKRVAKLKKLEGKVIKGGGSYLNRIPAQEGQTWLPPSVKNELATAIAGYKGKNPKDLARASALL